MASVCGSTRVLLPILSFKRAASMRSSSCGACAASACQGRRSPPKYRDPEATIPQVLADKCAAGEDIRLDPGPNGWCNQRVRPFDKEGGVALVVVDLQPLFIDPASPWGSEPAAASFHGVLPQVQELAAAVSAWRAPSGQPGSLIFTKFIPSDEPGTGVGTWARYYDLDVGAGSVTASELNKEGHDASFLYGFMPELAPLAAQHNARTVAKRTAGAFGSEEFRELVKARGITTVIVTGTETDFCVLSTVLGAVDAGIRVVVVSDACYSCQPNGHQAQLDYTFRRFYAQVEIGTAAEVAAQLRAPTGGVDAANGGLQ